jgi:hypothetical protein
MSQSQFDPFVDVSAGEGQTIGLDVVPNEFDVKGPLEHDEDSEEEREVYVFVLIQQTTEDKGEDPDAEKPALAKGHAVLNGKAKDLTEWKAQMVVQGDVSFTNGRPATGTAMTAEYSEDPVGFETYSWTERIRFRSVNAAGTATSR